MIQEKRVRDGGREGATTFRLGPGLPRTFLGHQLKGLGAAVGVKASAQVSVTLGRWGWEGKTTISSIIFLPLRTPRPAPISSYFINKQRKKVSVWKETSQGEICVLMIFKRKTTRYEVS